MLMDEKQLTEIGYALITASTEEKNWKNECAHLLAHIRELESNRLEKPVKPASSGLLQYITDKPMELPDNGAVQNEHGITASGVRVLNDLREILIKAGY